MLIIIDYGMGNLRSVEKACRRIGIEVKVSSNSDDIVNASKLILPGVGHFEKGMKNLDERNLIQPIRKAVLEDKIPLLGICLGMQLLTKRSDEGDVVGLGFVDVNTIKFDDEVDCKIPHMGWNTVMFDNADSLFEKIKDDDEFYFAHSYHIDPLSNKEHVFGNAEYGYVFPVVLKNKNILGVQFHPEKSYDAGLQLLTNFVTNY